LYGIWTEACQRVKGSKLQKEEASEEAGHNQETGTGTNREVQRYREVDIN